MAMFSESQKLNPQPRFSPKPSSPAFGLGKATDQQLCGLSASAELFSETFPVVPTQNVEIMITEIEDVLNASHQTGYLWHHYFEDDATVNARYSCPQWWWDRLWQISTSFRAWPKPGQTAGCSTAEACKEKASMRECHGLCKTECPNFEKKGGRVLRMSLPLF